MRNIWFVGDIHGEIRLLNSLLENILKFKPERIVFVGDYIDRGPHAREVIDRIMGMEVPVTCLLGNHEMLMLNAMEDLGYGMNPIELWYYNGGEATLQSFGSSSFFSFQTDLNANYLDFFRSLKMTKVVDVDPKLKILATHAGISPSIDIKVQIGMEEYKSLIHYLVKNRIDVSESFLWVRDAFFNSSPELWEGYLVVHGHTPIMKLKRFIESNGHTDFHFVENDLCIRKDRVSGKIVSVDIDSGSAISGRLSGLGFFVEEEGETDSRIRMRSLTVSNEEIFPRDLGLLKL
jgi:hypothetical protein